ncbi:minor capsid protein E [Carboxydothermus islandicus]|uniref:Minor capsid protein E n=1 Tax=Carboxydothermus islandicus TaxID=661089 RepID=A0A1L8D129_9THEO|nr:major capsid protein [Carboxydothermus islandicus]GAV24801.1 minor capsid protein E [Carboxydothermus islandicus]
MPIDLFSTRTMLEAVQQMQPVRTFLKSTFFVNERTFDTEYVDVDIIKGKRRMAPFVSPKIGGKVVERQGYRTNTYKAPMLAPKLPTTAEQLLKRLPGEPLYSGMSPEDRAAEQLGRDLAELDEIITRREEWMCAQALFTGQIHITGDGVDEIIDFGLTNKEVLTGTAKWSDPNSDPLADLKRWRQAIIKASGFSPDILIMASDVLDAFLGHSKIQQLLDLRLVDTGQINPQTLPNGTTYIGRIAELGVNIYTYDEWYLDDDGNEKPMVPEKTVLMASTSARFDLLYGAYVDVEEGVFDLPRVPRSWVEKDPSVRWVQMISRPLPVPQHIDSLYVATVL